MEIESIGPAEAPICHIYRVASLPAVTTFPTGPSAPLQAGFIVHPAGHEIPRHFHRPVERTLAGTSEVVLVLKGGCDVDVYDESRTLVATRQLGLGDVLVIVSGGHGFRMREDTVLFMVKQGPYAGPGEKESF